MNLSQFDYFDYSANGAEETTLTQNSVDIIKESILNQFKDPSGYSKIDFVMQFMQRYKLTLDEIADDYSEEEIAETKNLHRNFIAFMERTFQEQLNVGIVELDDMGEEEQDQMVHYLYRFFIINLNQNMFHFMYHYIKEHKDEILKVLPDTKTVSIRQMEEVISDPAMVKICGWIPTVTDYVINQSEVSVDDFFNLCSSKEFDLERDFIMQQYENFAVTGNFVDRYIRLLPESILVELETNLVAKFAKKYKKEKDKKKKD